MHLQKCLYLLLLASCATVYGVEHIKKDYYWKDYQGSIPEDALPGGYDSEGNTTYIAQYPIIAGWIGLGEVNGVTNTLTNQVKGDVRKNFKILCVTTPERYEWIKANMTEMATVAYKYHLVHAGSFLERPYVIGRAKWQNRLIVGQVEDRNFTFFAGKFVQNRDSDFEVLSYKPADRDLSPSYSEQTSVSSESDHYWREYQGSIPEDALPGGYDKEGRLTYIGRTSTNNNWTRLGEVTGGATNILRVAMREYVIENFEILCASNLERYEWVEANMTELETVAYKHHLVHVDSIMDRPCVVGRTKWQNRMIVGTVKDRCFTFVAGRYYQNIESGFEVLSYSMTDTELTQCDSDCTTNTSPRVKDYYWKDYEGSIPKNALPGGYDIGRRTTYIGRAPIEDDWTEVGGVSGGATNILSVSLEDYIIDNFEILCTFTPESYEWIETNMTEMESIAYKYHLVYGSTFLERDHPVGRVKWQDKLIVGFVESRNFKFFAGGYVHRRKSDFEVLVYSTTNQTLVQYPCKCGINTTFDGNNQTVKDYYWRKYMGSLPEDAFPGGYDKEGRPTYIGQYPTSPRWMELGEVSGGVTNILMIPTEHPVKENFEILCVSTPNRYQWVEANMTELSSLKQKHHLVHGGFFFDDPHVIGRVKWQNRLIIGPVETRNFTFFAGGHINQQNSGFEVLTFNMTDLDSTPECKCTE